MRNACLVDTNVLVYAYDDSETAKQPAALELLDKLVYSETGVLTTQVLGEFYLVITRRIPDPLALDGAETRLLALANSFHVLEVTPAIVFEAARGVREYGMSYWDAQIWASAKLNQVPTVLTEDLPSASIIEGVRFLDPFRADEDTQAALASLGLSSDDNEQRGGG